MRFISYLKDLYIYLKYRLKDNSASSIIWLINLIPTWAGFHVARDGSVNKLSWILYFIMVIYFYTYSNISHLNNAEGVTDIIKIYVNVIVVILAVSISHWFIAKRKMIKILLDEVIKIDILTRESGEREKYEKLLTNIKRFLYCFFAINFINTLTLYFPQRLNLSSGLYGTEPCPGITLTTPIHRGLCALSATLGDCTIIIVAIYFQSLLLFLIAHTSSMYLLLAEEMIALGKNKNNFSDYIFVKEKLPLLIQRHIIVINVVQRLKSLYSNPLGVNFAVNAGFMCLFFYLPMQEWNAFIPMLIYCFVVFFLYCCLCQKLINTSEDFEWSVYDCGWETFHLEEMKTVYIILKLAQRPVGLLAADMIPVNIYTFAYTMQSIFKFVTIVKI